MICALVGRQAARVAMLCFAEWNVRCAPIRIEKLDIDDEVAAFGLGTAPRRRG
jgi:hypothetical protein